MSLFRHRYLALFCCLFAAATLCGCFFHTTTVLIAAIAFTFLTLVWLVLVIFIKKKRATTLLLLLCCLFIAASLWNFGLRFSRNREFVQQNTNTEHELSMTVSETLNSTTYHSSYTVCFSLNGQNFNGLLFCEYPSNFQTHDIICGTVTLSVLEDHVADPAYYYSQNIMAVLMSYEDTLQTEGISSDTVKDRFHALNQNISQTLYDASDEQTASLLSAIALGNRDDLDNNILRDFKRVGLSHMLAISGMHLSVIILLLDRLLLLLGCRKSWRCISVFTIALLYLALIGFPLSAVRAFIMMSFVYLAFLVSAENDAMTALFASLFLILAISPWSVWDIGLWMSFLAVLGILVSDHFIKALSSRLKSSNLKPLAKKGLKALLSALIVSLFANVFVFLPICLFFDQTSLLSVFSTLAISPFISALLLLAPIFILSRYLAALSFLSPFLSFACKILVQITLRIVSHVSEWKNIAISLHYPYLKAVVIVCSIILFILLLVPLQKKRWILFTPAISLLILVGIIIGYKIHYRDTLTVEYLSRGESEMLILATTNDAVICDLSTGSSQDLYTAVKEAGAHCHTEISAIVFTHYHGKHTGSLSRIADQYVIRSIYLPYPQNEDEFFILYALLDTANYKNINVTLFDRNEQFSPAENITLLLSENVYLKRSTHPTFVLSVSGFGQSMTYLAESSHESAVLKDIAAEQIKASDFVILGTHGPITKSKISHVGLENVKAVFINDATILSYMDPSLAEKTELIYQSDNITFRLKNN